jgi:hypothetical protein
LDLVAQLDVVAGDGGAAEPGYEGGGAGAGYRDAPRTVDPHDWCPFFGFGFRYNGQARG